MGMVSMYAARLSSSKPAPRGGHFRQGQGTRKTYTLMNQVCRNPLTGRVQEVDVKRVYHNSNGTFGVTTFNDEIVKVRRILNTAWEVVSS